MDLSFAAAETIRKLCLQVKVANRLEGGSAPVMQYLNKKWVAEDLTDVQWKPGHGYLTGFVAGDAKISSSTTNVSENPTFRFFIKGSFVEVSILMHSENTFKG